jgi:hypothetical protein
VKDRAFAPGFRLSALDIVVLVGGTAAAGGLWLLTPSAAFVVAFVVAHFFLFCNVFRISRGMELAWGALFIVLAGATLITGSPGWQLSALVALLGTVFVVALEMRKPSYHGVFWRRINPGLREWWGENAAGGRQNE